MKNCGYEEAVLAAVRSAEWSDELRDHRESCLACAEQTLVASALISDAEALEAEEFVLPDPRVLWLRSSLEDRCQRAVRATQLISWVQRATLASIIAVVAFFLPKVLSPFFGAGRDFVSSVNLPNLPATVAAPGLVLMLTFSVLGCMALWNELADHG